MWQFLNLIMNIDVSSQIVLKMQANFQDETIIRNLYRITYLLTRLATAWITEVVFPDRNVGSSLIRHFCVRISVVTLTHILRRFHQF
jgi:hypothetical protein